MKLKSGALMAGIVAIVIATTPTPVQAGSFNLSHEHKATVEEIHQPFNHKQKVQMILMTELLSSTDTFSQNNS